MRPPYCLLLLLLCSLGLNAQEEVCPYLQVSAMTVLPADPMQELGPRLEVEITIDTFISEWIIGGYVDLVLVDAAGDSLTRPTGPHNWLPGNPLDTSRIALPFQDGISSLSEGFSGVLHTMHPVCTIEVEELVSGVSQASDELEQVRIFPNPVSAQVTISAEGLKYIRIYSMSGTLLDNRRVEREAILINLNQWRGKCFAVFLEDDKGRRSVRRIIKQ